MKYRSVMVAGFIVALGMTTAAQKSAAGSAAPVVSAKVSAPSPSTTPGLQERNPRYKLRKGDSFDLDFAMTPEFNQSVAIQPDGYVTLKSVGSTFVEGQTIPELTQTVTTAYAKILHDPIIAVSLKDFEKPYFIASGQVGRPGKYDLRGDLTVSEAVAIAGGFDEKSKHSQVVLFHPMPTGGYEARLINVKKLMATRNLSEDVRLQPGDMLFVPQNAFSKIRPFLPTANVSTFLGGGLK